MEKAKLLSQIEKLFNKRWQKFNYKLPLSLFFNFSRDASRLDQLINLFNFHLSIIY